MNFPPTHARRVPVCLALLALGVSLFFLQRYKQENPANTAPSSSHSPNPAPRPHYGIDLTDPQPSYALLRYVADAGGNANARSQAIVWLDDQARSRKPLLSEEESWLLSMIQSGGHKDWDIEYKLWLFNSACNALHFSKDPAPLTRLLFDLAQHHPHRTMRLYAMQHIQSQLMAGRLDMSLAAQIHDFLHQQILLADSELAGTALVILVEWHNNHNQTLGHVLTKQNDIPARAAQIAADSSRPVDVRVTALQAAGAHATDIARIIAPDAAQPVLVRKAAIAIIGTHGGENDLFVLKKLASENARLAQAAEPAQTNILQRLANNTRPSLVPF
jgi:hypothetical protein